MRASSRRRQRADSRDQSALVGVRPAGSASSAVADLLQRDADLLGDPDERDPAQLARARSGAGCRPCAPARISPCARSSAAPRPPRRCARTARRSSMSRRHRSTGPLPQVNFKLQAILMTTTTATDRTSDLAAPAAPAHRRREARRQRALDARRALGALRPRPARHPGHGRRPRPRPLPALQGPRAGRATTPSSPRRASSRTPGSTTWPARTAGSATTPTGRSCPGVEIGSGSLGHGLRLGVGTALGLRAQGLLRPRVYVLLGDAELDEGTNHEAIAYAGRDRPGHAHRDRHRQPVGHARLAGRDRQPVHRQRLDRDHSGRPRPRRDRDRR